MHMMRARWAAVGAAVAVTLGAGSLAIANAESGINTANSGYVPVTPVRILDTRPGPGNAGPQAVPLGPAQSLTLKIRGNAGVPTNATAVVLNVTAVKPTTESYITIWPATAPRPLAANLNPAPGVTAPNLVQVRIGDDGNVSFYNNEGSVDLVADVAGYYIPTAPDTLYAPTYAQVTPDFNGLEVNHIKSVPAGNWVLTASVEVGVPNGQEAECGFQVNGFNVGQKWDGGSNAGVNTDLNIAFTLPATLNNGDRVGLWCNNNLGSGTSNTVTVYRSVIIATRTGSLTLVQP